MCKVQSPAYIIPPGPLNDHRRESRALDTGAYAADLLLCIRSQFVFFLARLSQKQFLHAEGGVCFPLRRMSLLAALPRTGIRRRLRRRRDACLHLR